MRPVKRMDVLVLLGILFFSLLVHHGRMGASIEGVDLTTDCRSVRASGSLCA